MSIIDENLQNEIERGDASINGIEAKAYRRVFDALKKEPDFSLPANFADHVIVRMEARKESSRDFLWMGAGVVGFVIAAIISVLLTNFKFDFGVFKFMAGYPGLVAFGVVFILGLQWLDKKLIRPTISGS
ncbi:MAG: hypothetical protein WDN75_01905 [Bacteroidota bacterium]